MNGIEILSSEQVACEFAFNWTIFWIIFGAVFGFSLIMGIYEVFVHDCCWQMLLYCAFAGIVIGTLSGIGCGKTIEVPIAYETHYKVTIDDSVSMNEFLDKYEILDQEGKIYTVKERE